MELEDHLGVHGDSNISLAQHSIDFLQSNVEGIDSSSIMSSLSDGSGLDSLPDLLNAMIVQYSDIVQ